MNAWKYRGSTTMAGYSGNPVPVQDYTITGTITEIAKWVEGKPREFGVRHRVDGKVYNVSVSNTFFCMICIGDEIYALCRQLSSGGGFIYEVIQKPFIMVPVAKTNVIGLILTGLRRKTWKTPQHTATSLFNTVVKESGQSPSDEAIGAKVAIHLTEITYRYSKTREEELLRPYQAIIRKDEIIAFFEWWHKWHGLRRLWLFDLPSAVIEKSGMTTEELYRRCLENPYSIPGLEMKKCEEIEKMLGKGAVSKDKIMYSNIVKIVTDRMQRGCSAVRTSDIAKRYPDPPTWIPTLEKEYGCTVDKGCVYLTNVLVIEKWVAEFIKNQATSPSIAVEVKYRPESKTSDDQKVAVVGSLSHQISILNGKPGTGKTTTISEIIFNLELLGKAYRLVAFTGKAATRIHKTTLRPATTIHRLIGELKGYRSEAKEAGPEHKTRKPKEEIDTLIIDEVSMMSTELFYELMSLICSCQSKPPRIILVGDENQLRPITWGAFMSSLIESGRVPIYKLTTRHRIFSIAGEEDGISHNTDAIIDYSGDEPFSFKITNNFVFVQGGIERVMDLIESFKKAGTDPQQVTTICPYKESLSVLNGHYQTVYGVGKPSITDVTGIRWIVGDRVMAVENRYDIDVMNGEEGLVLEVTRESIEVLFDQHKRRKFLLPTSRERKKKTAMQRLIDEGSSSEPLSTNILQHSYAMSIDKAQGSEWNFVIVFIPPGSNEGDFLNKYRMITAISRGRRMVLCVGDQKMFENACMTEPAWRCEKLAERLCDLIPQAEGKEEEKKASEEEGVALSKKEAEIAALMEKSILEDGGSLDDIPIWDD